MQMMLRRLLLSLCCCFSLLREAPAEDSIHQRTTSSTPYRVTYWTTEQGLPQNTISCLLQTRDGYLWIGTRYGLVRYDGQRFTVYIEELGIQNSEDLDIRGLAEDAQGRLWMHSPKTLVCRYQGRFQVAPLQENSFPGPILHISPSREGGIWLVKPQGLFYLTNGSVCRSFSLPSLLAKDESPSSQLREVSEDEQGMLWVQAGPAHYAMSWRRFNPRNGAVESSEPGLNPAEIETSGLTVDHLGRIWVGKRGELLCWEEGRLSRFSARQAWGNHGVKLLAEDTRGHIWIVSQGPVQLFCFADGQFTQYDRTAGLVNPDDIRCLLPDREGNLWLGTGSGGLQRMQPRTLVSLLTGSRSTMDEVYSVAPGQGGKVWLATTYGLVRFQSSQFQVYTNTRAFDKDLVDSLSIPRVRPAFEDRDGQIWFGHDYYFLCKLQDGRLAPVTFPEHLTFMKGKIKSLTEDRAGNLWVTSPGGLLQGREGHWRLWTTNDGLRDNSVFGTVEDARGCLWVGSRHGGVHQLVNGHFRAYSKPEGLLSQEAWPLKAEADGSIWVGTPLGLNRIRDGQISAVTTRHGIHDNLAYCLLEDRLGNYWSFSNRGIWRMKKAELHGVADGRINHLTCITYGEDDGMPSAEGNGDQYPNASLLPNGELWFPTTRGVVIVDPDKLRDDEMRPLVVIEEVRADDETLYQDGALFPGRAFASNRSQTDPPIHLAPGRARVLSIRYTANTFVESDKARFRFQLLGYDTDWREADTRREAIYTNLRPGSYRFRVKACNHHGYWSELPAEFAFSLAPHFHETWLFYGLCGFLALSTIASWHNYRLRAIRRIQHLEQQQALEDERNRIAKDLHDDLGANLTGLALRVEVARVQLDCPAPLREHLLDLAQTIRAVADRMREVIWTVNPHCDTLDSFSAYLVEYAESFLDKAGLRCRFDLPTEKATQILSAEARHHLLLVAKEALNNAAKHAAATEIRLELKVSNGELLMIIQDNGCGFQTWQLTPLDSAAAALGSGRGLGNMRRRIELLGGHFDLASQPRQGTRITVRVPLTKKKQ